MPSHSAQVATVGALLRVLFPKSSVRVLMAISLVSVLLAVFLYTPLSPTALWRADQALASGNAALAVTRYDRVAAYNPVASLRQQARLRAATALAVELADPDGARARLDQLIAHETNPLRAADAWQRIGHLHLAGHRGSLLAADAFRRAYERAPNAPNAAYRLIAAARAQCQAGQSQACIATWQQVGEQFPQHQAMAWVHEAEQHLAGGLAERSLALFQAASSVSTDPNLAAAAKLGVTASLERLGNLEGAIAELDSADLSGRAYEARLDAMRYRDKRTR